MPARPDVDDVFAENRKLKSLVDEAHRKIRELESRLLDTADAKVRDLMTW